jgi:hypothetical protein
VPTDTAERPRRYSDTSAARTASLATFAKRRISKAIEELTRQGKTVVVIEPDGRSQTFHP